MKGPVYDKTRNFSIHIIALYKSLKDAHEFSMADQLLRAATSVGANVREAGAALSKKDFIFKMTIALKEAQESFYWLSILSESNIINYDYNLVLKESDEIIRIITKIIITSKNNLHNRPL